MSAVMTIDSGMYGVVTLKTRRVSIQTSTLSGGSSWGLEPPIGSEECELAIDISFAELLLSMPDDNADRYLKNLESLICKFGFSVRDGETSVLVDRIEGLTVRHSATGEVQVLCRCLVNVEQHAAFSALESETEAPAEDRWDLISL